MKFKGFITVAIEFLVIISLSSCILQPVQAQHYADGREVIYNVGPLSIDSPINTTYTTNQVCLNFSVWAHFDATIANVTIIYSLDKGDNVTIHTSAEYVPFWITDANGNPTNQASTLYSYYNILGYVELENLTEGSHSLNIFAQYNDYGRKETYFDEKTIHFTVDNKNTNKNETATKTNTSTNTPHTTTIYTSLSITIIIVSIVTCLLVMKNRTKNKHLTNNNKHFDNISELKTVNIAKP